MKHKIAALIHVHSLLVLAMMFCHNVDEAMHHAPVELYASCDKKETL